MKPQYFVLGALFLLVPNSTAQKQDDDPVIGQLAMKLTNRLLRAFDTRNYTGWTDFDVNFTFDNCFYDWNQTQFMKKVEEFRNSIPSGTVIKFGYLSSMKIIKQYDGIDFNIHFEFLGQHHDVIINFQRIRLSTHSLWRWVHAYKNNCTTKHKKVFTDNDLLTKVIS